MLQGTDKTIEPGAGPGVQFSRRQPSASCQPVFYLSTINAPHCVHPGRAAIGGETTKPLTWLQTASPRLRAARWRDFPDWAAPSPAARSGLTGTPFPDRRDGRRARPLFRRLLPYPTRLSKQVGSQPPVHVAPQIEKRSRLKAVGVCAVRYALLPGEILICVAYGADEFALGLFVGLALLTVSDRDRP